jgi:hypothetical protein
MAGVTNDFVSFKAAVVQFLGFEEGVAFEVLYDIFAMAVGETYTYDFAEFRRSSELCLAALLLARWKGLSVIFLSPTTYYGAAASQMMRTIAKQANYEITQVGVTVAGLVTREMASDTDVFLHHGRDFSSFLPPEAASKTHVMQIFKDEDVPHDTRSLSSLRWATYGE